MRISLSIVLANCFFIATLAAPRPMIAASEATDRVAEAFEQAIHSGKLANSPQLQKVGQKYVRQKQSHTVKQLIKLANKDPEMALKQLQENSNARTIAELERLARGSRKPEVQKAAKDLLAGKDIHNVKKLGPNADPASLARGKEMARPAIMSERAKAAQEALDFHFIRTLHATKAPFPEDELIQRVQGLEVNHPDPNMRAAAKLALDTHAIRHAEIFGKKSDPQQAIRVMDLILSPGESKSKSAAERTVLGKRSSI